MDTLGPPTNGQLVSTISSPVLFESVIVHFFGSKKWVLLVALTVLLGIAVNAFSAWLAGAPATTGLLIATGCGALFYTGLLAWASSEADGDKAWIAKSEEYRASKQDSAGTLPCEQDWASLTNLLVLSKTQSEKDEDIDGDCAPPRQFKMVDEIELDVPEGIARSRRRRIVEAALFPSFLCAIPQLLASYFEIAWIGLVVCLGGILLGLTGLLWWASKQNFKTVYPAINLTSLNKKACIYRNSHFWQYHQMMLLDAGWKELGDYRRGKTHRTVRFCLFVNQGCDMVVELGMSGGSLYYAIRSVTSAGHLWETNSLGTVTLAAAVTPHYTVREAARVTFEKALIQHAKWLDEVVEDDVPLLRWNRENCEKIMSSRLYVQPELYVPNDINDENVGKSVDGKQGATHFA